MGDVARAAEGVDGVVVAGAGEAEEQAIDERELGDAADHGAGAQRAFARMGDDLRARVNAIATKKGLPFQITGQGSIMAVHFKTGPIKKPEDWWPSDDAGTKRLDQLSKLFHLDMLEMGQYLARRGFISLSLPLTDKHYDSFVAAVEEFLSSRGNVMG